MNDFDYKAPYPHCDSNVLHAPGKCKYCDDYPEMQQARRQAGVNFTDEQHPHKTLCPAEQRRPLALINKWGGNVPKPRGT